MEPRPNHDHDTIDLSKLGKIIVRLDPENGPPLNALLEKHRQKLIKRSKGNGVPDRLLIPGRGYRCFDCPLYGAPMSMDMFEWHSLTK